MGVVGKNNIGIDKYEVPDGWLLPYMNITVQPTMISKCNMSLYIAKSTYTASISENTFFPDRNPMTCRELFADSGIAVYDRMASYKSAFANQCNAVFIITIIIIILQ